MRNIKQTSGFTLIELLVTLTVLGIMLAIGVPQYQRMTETNRMAGSINALASDLKLARTEAAKRSQIVTVCASTTGTNCNTTNWELGWIVFSDENRNSAVDLPNDIIVSRNAGLATGLTLRSIIFPNAGFIQYIPSGELGGTTPPRGSFRLCETASNNKNERARGINITNMGRVRTARDTNADNIREDIGGINFICP